MGGLKLNRLLTAPITVQPENEKKKKNNDEADEGFERKRQDKEVQTNTYTQTEDVFSHFAFFFFVCCCV